MLVAAERRLPDLERRECLRELLPRPSPSPSLLLSLGCPASMRRAACRTSAFTVTPGPVSAVVVAARLEIIAGAGPGAGATRLDLGYWLLHR